MGKKLIKDSTLTGIADAIRAKGGASGPMTPQEMPEKIAAIPTEEVGGAALDALIDRSITEISSSSATSIGDYAFQSCSALTTVDFPAATSIGRGAFASCSSLTTTNFPVVTLIEDYAFQSCSALTTVDFPVVTLIEDYAFQDCSKLTTVDLPVATSIGGSAFRYCGALKSLMLRGNNVCTLSSINAFKATLIDVGTGYIYVPSALIEQYKAATNWSSYDAQFRSLEDYTVDGTITGELDPSKVGV